MKKLFPVSVAGALAFGAVGAHASIAAPSSGTSDAVLFAEVVSASGSAVASYAGDTGQTVSQLLSLSSTPTTVLGGDANLAKLFAADGTGDTIVWGLEGNQYPGTSTEAKGQTQIITTNNANTLPSLTTTKLATMVTAFGAGITSLNSNLGSATSIEGTNPATAGVWDTTTIPGTQGIAFWGGELESAVSSTTTANLYYLTGGGSSFTNMGAKLEGTGTLTANGLVLAGAGAPPPVPLPPAVWLFGSGLLGLAGVARRKAKA